MTTAGLELLSGSSVRVVSSPHEAKVLMEACTYRIAIVTNSGVSPWEAISVVPPRRQFPVIFATGAWDDLLAALKRSHWLS